VALTPCALLAVPGNFAGLGGDARFTLAVFVLATSATGTPDDGGPGRHGVRGPGHLRPAALALPVFPALAKVLADRKRLVVMLALLFPTVILLSAVATLIGAGAHLITVSVLFEATFRWP
jgi:hypothetical protein